MNKIYYTKGTGIELALAVLGIIGTIVMTLQPIVKQKITKWSNSKQHNDITIVNETDKEIMMQLSGSPWFNVIRPGEKTELPDPVEDSAKNGSITFIGQTSTNEKFSCMNHFGYGDMTVQIREYNQQPLCQFTQNVAPAA